MAEPSIVLRAVEESDLEFTRATRSDPQVSSLALGRRFPITEVGERHWFERLGVTYADPALPARIAERLWFSAVMDGREARHDA